MNGNKQLLEELRWKKFPIGSDGFICLVDAMGDDSSIVQAARVSYGNDIRNDPDEADASEKDMTRLIRYLMRHVHTTPFEMAELKFLVRVPMDTWRQWIRHRTANVNEYSTRYTEAIDSQATTDPNAWRLQSQSNKQGSGGTVTEWTDTCPHREGFNTPGEYLSSAEQGLHRYARITYERRIALGVAREQARKDLPLSTYTEAYWKIDLHNLLHFLDKRMDSAAQLEIREYANAIGNEIVSKMYPITWQAFLDYRLNAMKLTAIDVDVIRRIAVWFAVFKRIPHVTDDLPLKKESLHNVFPVDWHTDKPHRERDECIAKLVRLGFVYEE